MSPAMWDEPNNVIILDAWLKLAAGFGAGESRTIRWNMVYQWITRTMCFEKDDQSFRIYKLVKGCPTDLVEPDSKIAQPGVYVLLTDNKKSLDFGCKPYVPVNFDVGPNKSCNACDDFVHKRDAHCLITNQKIPDDVDEAKRMFIRWMDEILKKIHTGHDRKDKLGYSPQNTFLMQWVDQVPFRR
ncbi:hypothetical protein M422DRAFT_244627 [Sphaerobolus stellatus SS14]|nr:hypothetical protein M422DRAFT_244627 [Sphaerobolus stellatus SS14]